MKNLRIVYLFMVFCLGTTPLLASLKDDANETIDDVKEKYCDTKDKLKEKVKDKSKEASDKYDRTKEKAKGKANDWIDKAKKKINS